MDSDLTRLARACGIIPNTPKPHHLIRDGLAISTLLALLVFTIIFVPDLINWWA